MFFFDLLHEVSKILAGFSPELVILLQISQPLCKPGIIAMHVRNRSSAHFYGLPKDGTLTQSAHGGFHPLP